MAILLLKQARLITFIANNCSLSVFIFYISRKLTLALAMSSPALSRMLMRLSIPVHRGPHHPAPQACLPLGAHYLPHIVQALQLWAIRCAICSDLKDIIPFQGRSYLTCEFVVGICVRFNTIRQICTNLRCCLQINPWKLTRWFILALKFIPAMCWRK